MRGSLRALAALTILVGLWAAGSEIANTPLAPGPLAVARALHGVARDGTLARAVLTTGVRLAVGYTAALVVGIPVGIALARSPLVRQSIGPVVLGLSSVPSICWLPLAILWFGLSEWAIQLVVVAGLDFVLYRSGIGAKIRAVSDDVAAADLIGLSSARIYAVAMGISFITIGIAAGFMSIWTNFDPAAGPIRLLIAFEVIVLGGLGSMWGSLAGGIVMGVAQSVGSLSRVLGPLLAGALFAGFGRESPYLCGTVLVVAAALIGWRLPPADPIPVPRAAE